MQLPLFSDRVGVIKFSGRIIPKTALFFAGGCKDQFAQTGGPALSG